MGKAAIHNPYLDTLGGGEKYTLAFAKVLADLGWQVDLEWSEKSILAKLSARFGLETVGINVVPDIKKGENYDLCFWVSDGSLPLLHARKNLLHFQVPFHDVEGRSLFNRMKLIRIEKVVCNSRFTAAVIDKEYGVKSVVIYPPVDVEKIRPKRKEKLILYVGRFSQLAQSKNHEILIQAFKKLAPESPSWKLVLAGGSEVGADKYLIGLQKMIAGYPIEIKAKVSFKELISLYGRAKIFWSAAGYGEDIVKYPERAEHFGITIAEAMAGGAIPIVFKAGGAEEIVKDRINGFFWQRISQLLSLTRPITTGRFSSSDLKRAARESAQNFSFFKFNQAVKVLLT
jgi:glycosyltransferase involved in cell wall biosynthesis